MQIRVKLVRADKKDWTFRYLYRVPLLGGRVQKLITDIDSLVSVSPDGRQLAYERCVPSRNDVELKLANADESEQRVLATFHNGSFAGFGPGLSWSPDGKTLAVSVLLVGSHPPWIVDVVSLSDGSLKELFHSPNDIGRPVWMPSGDSLVVSLLDALSHRAQLWTISFPSGQPRQLTRDLSDYTGSLDITREGTTVATVTQAAHSDIWLVSATDPSKGEQITSGAPSMFEVVQLPKGKILTASQNGLWTLWPDGTNKLFFNADLNNAFAPSPCGRFVVFLSSKSGTMALMRADNNGTTMAPISPNYLTGIQSFLFVPRTATTSTMSILINHRAYGIGRLCMSPDGRFLAYPYTEYTNKPEPGWHLAVISADGGSSGQIFKIPSDIDGPRWSVDGKSLQYLLTQNGATNIWERPLTEDHPRQLTHFGSGHIFDFSWSTDGRHLLLTRGRDQQQCRIGQEFPLA